MEDLILLAARNAPLKSVGKLELQTGDKVRLAVQQLLLVKDTLCYLSIWIPKGDLGEAVQALTILLPRLSNLTHIELLHGHISVCNSQPQFYQGIFPLLLQLPLLQHLSIGEIKIQRGNYDFTALFVDYLEQQQTLTSLRLNHVAFTHSERLFELLLQSPQCTISHLDTPHLDHTRITKRLSKLSHYCLSDFNGYENVDHLELTVPVPKKERSPDRWNLVCDIIASCPSIQQLTITMTASSLPLRFLNALNWNYTLRRFYLKNESVSDHIDLSQLNLVIQAHPTIENKQMKDYLIQNGKHRVHLDV
ncbi:hypothetical protein SAMD00019534_059220 [Acytostelium subglobosum LB1]|uniref:hypothetical protein n=1 Tax=Acytostelium subglobosum LB1 TaxID=1410327 RepID=UPI000644A867|nr:hypothetical protein SAMD00019534_059220 [Acytostelium subglobosum LB1]GAM22747.1 hypothetical protein SAMD00019534_059220 [Acytostelium subglobosum LB1]|eukprot:XP_012753974.1 hypothetical protein SAMD00019534_059220 [Acytostelium subglobosum LB1]